MYAAPFADLAAATTAVLMIACEMKAMKKLEREKLNG